MRRPSGRSGPGLLVAHVAEYGMTRLAHDPQSAGFQAEAA
jgi:hypothetical protein